MEATERPKCGSGKAAEEYDLPLHVGALSCGFPVAAKKIPSMKIPPNAFFFCKHFGTGVLILFVFM
ncbi:ZIP Zinc transporter [Blastomyces dermatitidis ATCC 18188]|uniref:ZIP Zinc transporter n=1 Tax=Ajellomyces dermatitidis (strain ATCC 18188 / CBS 674.68) TaxID=653446 RepID=F2T9G0_AJEDA|nr:ZIP Zinc transporter [Blastomyces dermatitidis ATCC 18188]